MAKGIFPAGSSHFFPCQAGSRDSWSLVVAVTGLVTGSGLARPVRDRDVKSPGLRAIPGSRSPKSRESQLTLPLCQRAVLIQLPPNPGRQQRHSH